ncbi:MAG TPA: hypothetical protein DDW50_03820 [Firmicutes bacterium]|jgi:hypothetical protein|nr:hypothetical protein [Bacillota bacterium]
MLPYYLLEEDLESESKIFLGPMNLNPAERQWMVLGDVFHIPDTTLDIPVKYAPPKDKADFLNRKIPLVSNDFKGILEQKASGRIYFREAILECPNGPYLYFYVAPPLCDCFDYRNSEYGPDPKIPGGIRISGGFCLRPGPVGKLDIFRAKGLSSRKIIISEWLKEICEANAIKGVRYIRTEDYYDV